MFREAARASEDAGWLSETIWAGLVPFYGPVWTSLVGTPEALALAFLDYKAIGVTQFIISGCPELPEVTPVRTRDPAAGSECGACRSIYGHSRRCIDETMAQR